MNTPSTEPNTATTSTAPAPVATSTVPVPTVPTTTAIVPEVIVIPKPIPLAESVVKGAAADSWGRACGATVNSYRVCVSSPRANQVIFQAGPVAKGDRQADAKALKAWLDSRSVYGSSGCIDVHVCSTESLRWNAEFVAPRAQSTNAQWFACSLFMPESVTRSITKNGISLADTATYLVQNAAPLGNGRNCQVE